MNKIEEIMLLALISSFLVSSTFGTQQSITFYSETSCSGSSTSYTSTAKILPPWDNATLSYKFVGVWRLNGIDDGYKFAIIPINARTNGQCFNSSDPLNDYKVPVFTLVERVGPEDMTTNQLILYSGKNFEGNVTTVTGNTSSIIIPTESYAHFGKAAWLLYSNVNFTGTHICLEHAVNGNGDTYSNNLGFNGSALSISMFLNGVCPDIPEPTTTTTTTTTTTQKPSNGTENPGDVGGSSVNAGNILLTVFIIFFVTVFTTIS